MNFGILTSKSVDVAKPPKSAFDNFGPMQYGSPEQVEGTKLFFYALKPFWYEGPDEIASKNLVVFWPQIGPIKIVDALDGVLVFKHPAAWKHAHLLNAQTAAKCQEAVAKFQPSENSIKLLDIKNETLKFKPLKGFDYIGTGGLSCDCPACKAKAASEEFLFGGMQLIGMDFGMSDTAFIIGGKKAPKSQISKIINFDIKGPPAVFDANPKALSIGQQLQKMIADKMAAKIDNDALAQMYGIAAGAVSIDYFYPKDKAPLCPAILNTLTGDITLAENGGSYGMEKVKLRNASALAQPVFGTDANSTYYCIAIGDNRRVAARRMGDRLSIRLEGMIDATLRARLEESEVFTIKSNQDGDYASCHIDALGVRAEMAYTAALIAAGPTWDKVLPLESLPS